MRGWWLSGGCVAQWLEHWYLKLEALDLIPGGYQFFSQSSSVPHVSLRVVYKYYAAIRDYES